MTIAIVTDKESDDESNNDDSEAVEADVESDVAHAAEKIGALGNEVEHVRDDAEEAERHTRDLDARLDACLEDVRVLYGKLEDLYTTVNGLVDAALVEQAEIDIEQDHEAVQDVDTLGESSEPSDGTDATEDSPPRSGSTHPLFRSAREWFGH